MASIEERGPHSYRIIVCCGYDSNFKKIVKRKTVKLDRSLTPKQAQKEIQRLAYEFESRVLSGQVCDGDNLTLEQYLNKWLNEHKQNNLELRTIDSYKSEIDSKIIPTIGHIKLNKLKPLHLLEFYNNLFEDGVRLDNKPGGYSNRTVKYQHQILSSALNSAVKWGLLESNPCDRVEVPKIKSTGSKTIKFFNEFQTMLFLDGIKEEDLKYQAISHIAVYTGLRKGELLGLTWDDIDFDNCTIDINKANGYLPNKGMFTKSTKNTSSERCLFVPKSVIDILKQYKLWQNKYRMKCGELWQNNNLLFTQWNGKPMFYTTPFLWFKKFIRKYNKKIKEDSNIPEKEKESLLLPEISFHGIRHTSATLMISQLQKDYRSVAARMGHAAPSTTLNIYSHSLKSSDKAIADDMENLLNSKHG